MLREIESVRQDGGGRRRRWFQDDYFDLFLWIAADGSVRAFHLCYEHTRDERVLAWSADGGFSHRGVDDGEDSPAKNMTPIFVDDGVLAARRVRDEFRRRSTQLDRSIASFLSARLDEATAPSAGAGGG